MKLNHWVMADSETNTDNLKRALEDVTEENERLQKELDVMRVEYWTLLNKYFMLSK